jgi:hypothetical protein
MDCRHDSFDDDGKMVDECTDSHKADRDPIPHQKNYLPTASTPARQVRLTTHGVVVGVSGAPQAKLRQQPFSESVILLELPDSLTCDAEQGR